jgi:hypothetical protein
MTFSLSIQGFSELGDVSALLKTPTRIIDVVEESGPEIVSHLLSDIRFCLEYPDAIWPEKATIEKIAISDSSETTQVSLCKLHQNFRL